MTSSKTLFFLCLSFVSGIFLESSFGIAQDKIIKTPQIFLWVFLISGIALIFIYFLSTRPGLVVGFCLLFLVMGILRMQISEFNIASDKLSKLNGKGQVVLTGIISDEPDYRDVSQKLKVKVSDSTVLVTIDRYPEYEYLDKIKLTGKLETPMVADDFNYKNYLLPEHIYSVMNFPVVELISQKHQYNIYSYLYEKILFLKQGLRQSIENNFLPPQSSILQGTILGDNGAMSQDLKDKLNITGLRHFIAISGLHIVILISIVMSFLLAVGMWRSQAFYITVIFICIYIILTGASAAALRAGIMGGTYLLAQKLGRQALNLRLVVLAAALMLLANPLLLFYDVGFQLSFLAVLGLIYFEPLVRGFLKFLLKKIFNIKITEKHENILIMVSVTIAAQIFTLPITVFNFGIISWVSPIANILILPIFYYLILFGFLSSLIGIIWSALGWILSVPC
jgi:competence protein ComEC